MKRITLSALLMTLFLIIGCNNEVAEKDPQKVFLTSIANLGKGFLDVFVTFGDMVTNAFGIKADTKKSEVGKYFTDIETTMTSVKKKLQDAVKKNGNYLKVKEVVDQFITGKLDKIAEGAKTAGEAIGSDDNPIANVATGAGAGAGVAGADVEKLVKGIKDIVDVVLKDKGSADAGTDKKAEDGSTERTGGNAADGEAGKLFASDNAGNNAANAKKAAADAAKAVGAVTGADILKAMVKDKGDAAKLASGAADANSAKKDAVIAGAIALRAMAKDGKFAGKSDAAAEYDPAVKGAAVSAVTKALNTLTIAIRNTVDSGLKSINDALAAVTQEDKSAEATQPAATTPANATGGNQ
ncbi:variable large protein (plasmid) [Candidatus Borrelia fainii]|uniref:Variable large protein n=1 Tax=Candidatus Borrelia fainii TaxID=2518322 RepID=A0ABM8DLH9_9SPIR|nr:variable large family protein [Candidatus Borrelia fainii]BDU63448.1 variable large protein [Candidatus Borrelia fainii]BDU63450.1 variable large protein [Candidatus Borrelia fainii]